MLPASGLYAIPPALTAMRNWKKVDEKILHRKFLCLFSGGKDFVMMYFIL